MGQREGHQRMERQKAVVDASVCAKWFLDEDYSENARLLRDSFVKGRLDISVPSLLFYETLNALRYSRLYDEKELGLAAESLSKYGFDVWGPKGEVYNETAHLSIGHDVSVYDASYISLSILLHAPFYTADRELLEKFPRVARHIKSFQ
jgi:predicted nucleic acid-binding protein